MLPDNSVDAIVCDPPYGLRFMGKKWDYDVPGVDIWVECLRVLKPGGHLLAFAGTRTQHRMAVRIEDAGFEIRDMIAWVYGSGYPKHRSSLKPALEPITMARKPAERATLLNIDACRVPPTGERLGGGGEKRATFENSEGWSRPWMKDEKHVAAHAAKVSKNVDIATQLGRYPANLIHDGSDEVVAMFPDSAGSGGSVPNVKISGYGDGAVGTGSAEYLGGERTKVDCGTGSAARFFYCAKASKKDRNEGCEGFASQRQDHNLSSNGCGRCGLRVKANGSGNKCECGELREPVKFERSGNTHPTVKPTELMRYLCRLVTPPGGLIVDPFAGSGSTGKAAILEGFQFIGFELDPQYSAIANARVEAAKASLCS